MPKRPAPRRAKGEGYVRPRKDGRWECVVTVGKNPDGSQKRRSVYGKTEADVTKKATQLKADLNRGLYIDTDKTTFKEFATDWIERASRGKAANTKKDYEDNLGYAFKSIGDVKLQSIKPVQIRMMLEGVIKDGYESRTVKKTLQHVKSVFQDALGLELIHRNPAEAIKVNLPASKPKGKSLEPEDVSKLLELCEGHHAGLLFRLILATGLRKSEALGLTWADVNSQTAQLRVTKGWVRVKGELLFTSPKTRNSKRSVPVPSNLLARLEKRKEQNIALLLEKGWRGNVNETYVFGVVGKETPFVPDMPNKWLNKLLEQASLPHYRVHDLRHTYGSLQLRMGVPLEVVSERMGHANPTITLNTYRHVLEDERRGHVYDIEEVVKPVQRVVN